MFQFEWGEEKNWSSDTDIISQQSAVDINNVQSILETTWEEHCVECAVPECYTTCSLYERRKDGACARFSYGIIPNFNFKGRYNHGADLQFKQWGKLEADLNRSFIKKMIDYSSEGELNEINSSSQISSFTCKPEFDEFVLECYSTYQDKYRLLLEYFIYDNRFRITKSRHVFEVKHGYNFFRIAFDSFNIDKLDGFIYLYPENCNDLKRIIITWLDFVKYKPILSLYKKNELKKVKCIAWDLDNTLWEGVISEQENIIPNKEAIKLIKQLDEKGILHTIISKNDFKLAWSKIEEIGIQEYFLYPAINWERKSQNIKNIAKQLNIGIESFAVIDDSAFEREEILTAHPEVKVYSEKQIIEIANYEEFNVIVTQSSKQRRITYLDDLQRKNIKNSFTGSYDDFLKSCNMTIEAFIPYDEFEILRCWELIHRTNQLNLSGNRYSWDKFVILIKDKNILPIALQCLDRFGDYGIIGYASIHFTKYGPVVEDFVLSCRVAQKKVEHTFFNVLANFLFNKGYNELMVKLVKSAKNEALQQVLKDIPFGATIEEGNVSILSLSMNRFNNTVQDIMGFKLQESVLNYLSNKA